MKKLLLIVITCAVVMGLFAQNASTGRSTYVTAAQALEVGYTFMRTGGHERGDGTASSNVRKQTMQLIYTGVSTDSLTRAVTECYYVFSLQPTGFVIVSADERAEPILGYSYNGHFQVEDMPENVRVWLKHYVKQIMTAVYNGSESTTEITERWSILRSGQPLPTRSVTAVSPLIQTNWSQGTYYNQMCPADANGPNGHAITGCVATAMAQIIRYWQWPNQGINSHSYNSNYGTLSVDFNSATYNYNNMPNALSSSSSSSQVNEVAKLMYHCGVAVDMEYAADGSVAYFYPVIGALYNYFAYENNGTYVYKSRYSDNDWSNLIKQELNNARPVFYSGQGPGYGHAFVCDGYDYNGYFHFNWGWGSYYNEGYYALDALTPANEDFTNDQEAIIGISATGAFIRCATSQMMFDASNGGESEVQTLSVRGHSLSGNINVTVGNGFKVSTNGTSYSTNATLSSTGGTLYVKFIPASPNNTEYTMTLTSGTCSASVILYGSAPVQTLPTITTNNISNISSSTAICGGNVTSDGGATVYARGVCWSTSLNPTVSNSHTTDGTGTGSFTSNITGLTSNTTYYVRAYATNSMGTSYGNQVSFTTESQNTDVSLFSGLVAYYPFDDDDLTDHSGNVNNGTNYSTTSTSDRFCNEGKARNFAGVDNSQYIEVPNNSTLQFTDAATVSMWFCMNGKRGMNGYGNSTETGNNHYLFAKLWDSQQNMRARVTVLDNGMFLLASEISQSCAEDTIQELQIGQWAQATFVYTTTYIETYLNGRLIAHTDASNSFTSSNGQNLRFGKMGGKWYPLNGKLDDIRIFNRALNADEVAQLYNIDIVPKDSLLVMLPLDGNVTDYSGNGFEPVIHGNLTPTAGHHGIDNTAFYFPGQADSWIEIPHDDRLSLCGSFTVSAWYNRDNDCTEGNIIGKGRDIYQGWKLHTNNINVNGAASYQYHGAETSAATISSEIWYMTTGVYDSATHTLRHYLNGELVDEVYDCDVPLSTNFPVAIGRHLYSESAGNTSQWAYPFRGEIDDIVIYNRPLSTEEIQILYSYNPHVAGCIIGVPTVVTNAVANVSNSTATCGGNVTSDGGATVTARGVCWSTSSNPTISNSHTTDGSGTGNFTSSLTGLTPNTTYYVRAYATNSAGTAYGAEVSFATESGIPASDAQPCPGVATVTDYSGNVYNTVKIGEQCWMRENLRVKYYEDGMEIPAGTQYSSNAPYCFYPTDDTNSVSTYGYLYNWYAIMHGITGSSANPSNVQGVCPEGWHIPSNAEWEQLFEYVRSVPEYVCDMDDNCNTHIAKALASAEGWTVCNDECTVGNNQSTNNATGFSAISIGGDNASFWSSEENAASVILYNFGENVWHGGGNKNGKYSVRCVLGTGYDLFVSTNTVSSVTQTSALCGGNVTYSGNTPITARGVCWSTSQNPTVNDNHTTESLATGSFTSNLTGLTPNTTYYVRAYVTNGSIMCYGEQRTFTTSCNTVNISVAGTTTINYGQSTTLTVFGADSYSWNNGDTGNSITVSPSSTTTYCVTGSNQYGCTDTAIITVWVTNSNLPEGDGFPCSGYETVTDIDGNVYNTVKIGQQCWMKENLRVEHYADGTEIDLNSTTNASIPYRYYPNNNADNVHSHGYLYNWPAVLHGSSPSSTNPSNVQGICPTGWHVPSNAEWTQLSDYVSSQNIYTCGNDSSNIAKAMAANYGWLGHGGDCVVGNNQSQNNATGFSALPAGGFNNGNYFYYGVFGETAVFWSSSRRNYSDDPFLCVISFSSNKLLYTISYPSDRGFSVRCVHDNITVNVSIEGNTTIDYGQSTTLTASGANYYSWSTGSTDASITVSPTATTTYTVTGSNNYGSADTVSVTVIVNSIAPAVTTGSCASYYTTYATFSGNVISDGGATVTARGICWNNTGMPTVSDAHTTEGSGTGSFTSHITGLNPNTTYYVRAYATNSKGTSYGAQRMFTTMCDAVNVSISGTTAINSGQSTTLTASGANSYSWSIGGTSASITVSPTATTTYIVTGTNSYGCTDTASVTVTVNYLKPTVTTKSVSNIAATTASCGGNVTADGGSAVTARGVCWSTSTNPTISNNHTTNGSGTGSFTSSMTGLVPNKTYYVRAYATNSVGTSYGTQKTFTTSCNTVNVSIAGTTTISYGGNTTLAASGANSYSWSTGSTNASITVSPTATTTYTVTGTNSYGCTGTASVTVTVNYKKPTVTTKSVTDIAATTATCGGNVTADGGATVTVRGVCWSTSQNPTVSGSHTTDGSGTGSFTSSITGLAPNTTYYVRAYATNSVGTSYGTQKSFTTSCNPVDISIAGTTTVIYGQSTTLTASGANSYSWNTGSTSANITVSPTATTTYTVTGTNSNGCTGTASVTVMVKNLVPTVTTNNVSNIAQTTATCGGEVTASGGVSVTERGVCWSTTHYPTIGDSHTSNGSGTGAFTSSLTELEPGVTYYVRAYATNSIGTAYGQEMSFVTEDVFPSCPVVIETLPFMENFDNITTVTTTETGVEPDCWLVVTEDVALTNATKPQVYHGYAASGSYSLRLKNRCVYAMPALDDEINTDRLQMTFKLRQPKSIYRLQVGVVNGSGEFEVVKTINNASTDTEPVTVEFSGYTGSGHRIAFRNTLVKGSTLDYSINYIDDIVITKACGIDELPYTENFDSYTASTTTETGVQPDCWEVVTEDVALTNATKPQIYRGSASSGSYSLRMKNRCVYAMPELMNDVNIQDLTMTFNLRQPNSVYRLQVGVVNENGEFQVVRTINNASTEMESIAVNFANYTGDGHRIAFRNTLVKGSTLNYSINYLDDINITYTDACKIVMLPYMENFEEFTATTSAETGVQPDCWEVLTEDVALTASTKPQLYRGYATSGYYTLRLKNRCVYAMPELMDDVNVQDLTMTFNLRQSNSVYRLQVGVINEAGEFEVVKTVNNAGTGLEPIQVNFSNYAGNGHRIAFRNTLKKGSTLDYSINYIDDIVLDYTNACKIIEIPYAENFEAYTTTTTAETGVQPDCWEIVTEEVALSRTTMPQLYRGSASSGSYSLRLKNRCVYAMPELMEDVNIQDLTMTFNLRQPKAIYRLQVGVVNESGVFKVVKTINNASTEIEPVTVNFANYTGDGHRIAFRNTLVSGSTLDYSFNYLDDITFNYTNACEIRELPYSESFDSYTTSTATETGVQPECWEVTTEDVALTDATKPQLYRGYATSGAYVLRLKNRCVYAMPELSNSIDVQELTMTFNLRQPKAVYRLQVGVLDEQGNFNLVKTINNASTNMEEITVDFSNYTGGGHRIAFRNTLTKGSTLDYSINYIDDINLVRTTNNKGATVTEANALDVLSADRNLVDIIVYPNPTKDVVNVECTMNNVQGSMFNDQGSNVQCTGIEVIDVYGKVVRNVVGANNDSPTQINVSGLAAGMYFVRATTDRGVVTKPFVKR